MDINHFKSVNDLYGHPAGDLVLQQTGQYFSEYIRDTDFVARYGGDEFVGLFFESDSVALEGRLNELLRDFKANPLAVSDTDIIVSFSFGISSYGADGVELTTLLKVADQRMYAAKKQYKKEQAHD